MKNIFLVSLVLSPFLMAQGGWTRAPKSWFIKFDASHLLLAINPLGEDQNSAFRQHLVCMRMFRKRLTFIFSPLCASMFETLTAAGIGDLRLKQIPANKHRFRLGQYRTELPTGRANAYAANKTIPTIVSTYLPATANLMSGLR